MMSIRKADTNWIYKFLSMEMLTINSLMISGDGVLIVAGRVCIRREANIPDTFFWTIICLTNVTHGFVPHHTQASKNTLLKPGKPF